MVTVGRSATTYLTLPLVGVGVAAFRMASEFGQAMANVDSIMKLSRGELAKYSDQVLALTRELPQDAVTLAQGLYNIASSGFKGAEAMKILEASARAASAGMSTTEVSAKAITSVLNAYGLSAKQAASVSDTLFIGVEQGVMTFEELASSIGDYIGAAAALKIPLEDVVAAQAAMTLTGINAYEASISLNNVLRSMLKPSEQMADALGDMGYETGQAAIKAEGLDGVMAFLAERVGNNKQEWLKLFPEIRAARGAMALTANDGEGLNKVLGEMEDKVGATGEALERQARGPAYQFQVAMNRMRLALIELGNTIIPILLDTVIPAVQKAVAWFGNLSDSQKELIVKIAAAAAALGPASMLIGGLLRLISLPIRAAGAVGQLAGAVGRLAGIRGAGTVVAQVGASSAGSIAGASGLAGALLGPMGLVAGLGALQLVAPGAAKGIRDFLQGISDDSLWKDFVAFITMEPPGEEGWAPVFAEQLRVLKEQAAGFVTADMDGAALFLDNLRAAIDKFNNTPFEFTLADLAAGVRTEELAQFINLLLRTPEAFAGVSDAAGGLWQAFRSMPLQEQQAIIANYRDSWSSLIAILPQGVTQVLHNADAQQKFLSVLQHAENVTAKEATSVARLVEQLYNYGGSLNAAETHQLDFLLSTNQTKAALALLRGQVNNTKGSVDRLKGSVQKLTPEEEAAAQKARALTGDLRGTAGQAGTTKGKVDAYKGSLDKLPLHKKTSISAPGVESTTGSIWGLVAAINAIDTSVHVSISTEYDTYGTGLARAIGGIRRAAMGGVLAAHAGMITRSPTMLVGEGTYNTRWGRGAEAILPLDSRGIRILSQAIAEASKIGGHGAPGGRPPRSIEIILEVDGKRWARALVPYIGEEQQRQRIRMGL